MARADLLVSLVRSGSRGDQVSFRIRHEGLIGSYLGETANQLQQVSPPDPWTGGAG